MLSLALVAALHLYIVAVSLYSATHEPSPDLRGLTTTHHLVDFATSAAYLLSVLGCAVLVARYIKSGRAALLRSAGSLWAVATMGACIAAVALGVEVWAVAVDYQWSYSDFRSHGDRGALIMDFIGVYALSFPILAPVGCLWFERLEA